MVLRGVNLGGWLVLEKWMTPSLFVGTDAEDEFHFVQTPGAKQRLQRHWQTFVTEQDIAWLADHGINALRIPVGYWIFGEQPFYATIKHLDRIMNLAERYGMHVIICLHGAPGSQNGEHHSGVKGKVQWHGNRAFQEKTIRVLMQLAERYREHQAFWGLEILNEPRKKLFQPTLRRFYREAYSRLVTMTRVVFSDAFTPRRMAGALPRTTYMDIHWYHFGWTLHRWLPLRWYYRILDRRPGLIARLQKKNPVIIGEWSLVVSREALQRYPEDAHMNMTKEFSERQLEAYESATGWFYWSYKTESAGVWNFRWCVENGLLNL